MGLSRSEEQVEWAAANYKDVTFGASEASDAVTLASTIAKARIQLKSDNQSTPADGDTIDFYSAATLGDPDGASTDEYPTDIGNMEFLATIDTFDTDAESVVVNLEVAKGVKIYAVSNAAANTIRVSACILQWFVS